MQASITTLAAWTGLHKDTVRRRLSSILTGTRGELVDSTIALPLIFGNGERLDPQQEKARLDRTRREAAELDLAVKRREVISMDECFGVIDIAATACREHLMGIPGRFASILASESDPMRIEQVMSEEIRQALNHIADSLSNITKGPAA